MRRRAAAAAVAMVVAMGSAHAQATAAEDAKDLSATIAAVDAARTDATRDFASEAAAAAAFERLERLRMPLVAADDPRAAIWMADAAEDALTVGLSIGQCGAASAIGLPTPDQRARATALLRAALASTRAAEAAARATLDGGTASPELAARLDGVELARRIPLIRACAATLAGWSGALPDADAPAILDAAAARLTALRPGLPAAARPLAEACLGLALARLGRAADADAVLAPLAADRRAAPTIRALAIAGLAESASTSPAGRRRSLDMLRTRHAEALDDATRLLLGDLDFRLARAAALDATGAEQAAAAPWRAWLDAVAAAPPATRDAVRAEAIVRIARAGDGLDDAVVRAARALARVREPATREDGAAALRTACADPGIDPAVRAVAQLELGRALLLLGRAAEGADALLEYARANQSEPASRHAIDAAVAAARGTGDAMLLARVLATAVGRFPEHPDHPAWRVEQAALALAPDAPEPAREAPSVRAARAIDALDRADRAGITDPALRADLAIAAAEAMSEQLDGDAALAALARVGPDDGLPQAMRDRLLEERIRAAVVSGRSLDADTAIAGAIAADRAAAADAAARVLRRMSAVDLAMLASAPLDARRATDIARLADATVRMAPATPERDEVLARALVAAGLAESAVPVARRAIEARGDRLDLMLALAEALWGVGGTEGLGEAMTLYDRVGRAAPERSPTWWLTQLRRLQILDRVGRSTESIGPRVMRLRAIDPALGGPQLASAFLELAARHE
jgi:hypothetical protein